MKRRRSAEAAVERQADFLPTFEGGPVVGGPMVEDQVRGRTPLRARIPSEREILAGARPIDEVGAPDPEPMPASAAKEHLPRAARIRTWAAYYNPLSIPGDRRPLLVFGLLAFLAGFDDAALALIGPELRTEFGLSLAFLIRMGITIGLASELLGLPVGYLTDRVKRVWLVRISAIGSNVASLIKATAPGVGQLILGDVVNAGSGLAGGPATFPLMADYYPSRARGRAYAFLSLAVTVATLLTVPVAGFLITRYGWRPVVFLSGIIALVASMLTFLLREPVRGGMDRLELGASEDVAAKEQPPLRWQEAFRAAWSIRTLRLQAFGTLVRAFTTPVAILIGLIYAERFLLDPFQRSLLTTVGTVGAMAGLAVAGPISEKVLSKRPSTLVLIQSTLSFVGFALIFLQALAPTLAVFIIPSLMFTIAGAMLQPASITIISLIVPARVRGLGMQMFAPFSVAGALISFRLAGIADTMTIQHALLLFSPFYLLAGMLQLATAATIGRDVRAARAAAMAEEVARKARADGGNKMLICRDVDVAYDGVRVLSGVDLDVDEGETVVLVGTNGAGKSTLLRAIAGLQQADNGAVFLDGRDVTATPAHQLAEMGVVFMPGGHAVFGSMTVRENLTTALWMNRDDTTYVNERIEEILAMLPALRPRLDTSAHTLSGGEQQMVALGQALLMRPRLLMIDELSLGLAPAIVGQLLDILAKIREAGTTIILVEQSLNVAAVIAERAIFMDKGRIEFDGSIDELLSRSDLVRSIFMGGAAAGSSVGRRRVEAEATDVVLRAEDLSLSYGGVHALREVSVELRAGEVVGIIGPNGAGKTTLFDVLSGYSVADAGRVFLKERDVTALLPFERATLGLSRAFQNARLFPALTVRETIAVALEKRAPKNPLTAAIWLPAARKKEARLRRRVDGYIELLGLGDHADKFVRELSTGSRRAVEVACMMAADPDVLLLDEPSSGLAQAEIEALGPALMRIARETGCALLVIEHDLPLITRMSERLIAMELGEVVAVGSPEDVTSDPRVLQSYLAASEDVINRSGSRVGAAFSALAGGSPSSSRRQL
jgi:ABC-type branched-subunit amino acid transport system ATPase component/sugar phosphate permease